MSASSLQTTVATHVKDRDSIRGLFFIRDSVRRVSTIDKFIKEIAALVKVHGYILDAGTSSTDSAGKVDAHLKVGVGSVEASMLEEEEERR